VSEPASQSSPPPDPAVSRARAEDDAADLAPRLRHVVDAVRRTDRAAELLVEGYGEGRVARKLMAEYDIGYRRAWDFVSAALEVMASEAGRISPSQRRATLLAKTQSTYRKALAKKRAFVVGESVDLIDEPDLRAAQAALEMEAKLYGVADAQSDQRAIALVLDVARAVLEPTAFAKLVRGVQDASDRRPVAELPVGSGEQDDDAG
jgi:hypothetical protein